MCMCMCVDHPAEIYSHQFAPCYVMPFVEYIKSLHLVVDDVDDIVNDICTDDDEKEEVID